MAKFPLTRAVYHQWKKLPPVAMADLTGKTVMVIGANTGMGFEASKHFARMNPGRLILACRSATKGEAAIQKLQKETGYRSAELWMIDLSQFSSVTAFADKFEKDGGRLDILVENAAVVPSAYDTTPDGWEMTLQVNCLSLSLLALRLLPQMVRTSEDYATRPRLVVVTSGVHFGSKIEKPVLDRQDIYKALSSKDYCTPAVMAGRYDVSKLLNVFFYQGLNERLPTRSRVIVNGVCPGFCYSDNRQAVGFRAVVATWLMEKALARTTEAGGRQLVYGAVGGADNEDRLRGAYIMSAEVHEASDFAIGAEGKVVQNKLWSEMMEIFSKVDPRVREVADKYLTTPAK